MYFIEYIIKKLTQKNKKNNTEPSTRNNDSGPEFCDHLFMPIDSTNELLSCSKCGFLIKKSDLKNKNFFAPD